MLGFSLVLLPFVPHFVSLLFLFSAIAKGSYHARPIPRTKPLQRASSESWHAYEGSFSSPHVSCLYVDEQCMRPRIVRLFCFVSFLLSPASTAGVPPSSSLSAPSMVHKATLYVSPSSPCACDFWSVCTYTTLFLLSCSSPILCAHSHSLQLYRANTLHCPPLRRYSQGPSRSPSSPFNVQLHPPVVQVFHPLLACL